MTHSFPYEVNDESELTLVIELAYNNFGGLYFSPWLSAYDVSGTMPRSNLMSFLIIFMIGCMFAAFIISLAINFGTARRYMTASFSVFQLFLLLNQLTWKDSVLIWSNLGIQIDYRVYATVCFISQCLVPLCFLYNLKKENIFGFSLKIAILPCLILYSLTAVFHAYSFQWVFMALNGCYCLYFAVKLILHNNMKKLLKLLYSLSFLLLFLMFSTELCDGMGYLVFGTEAIVSLMLVFAALLMSLIHFLKIKRISEDNEKALILKMEFEKMKERMLRAQIKPHFIFNTLTCIQSLYHDDLSKGDEALGLFSKHLRLNVDSESNALVGFEDELDNTQNYFRLENMRYENRIELYFDINKTDFRVPILSLQPFVENSVKHSRVYEKSDSYIQISSDGDSEYTVIKVIDNGIGFEPDDIKESSCGIRNCVERLKSVLGTTTEIVS